MRHTRVGRVTYMQGHVGSKTVLQQNPPGLSNRVGVGVRLANTG